jgi:glycosyltransferase involved in cell wall biosynthesis
MRIVLVDPLAYTPPYDHALASALAERGHSITVLTSRFPHGRAPAARGYGREELFAPLSTRLFRRSPLRLPAKGVEYAPSVARLVRRVDRLNPDVVHVQWLPRPEVDLRWLRRIAAERPVVLTAHDVLPRRARALSVWPDVLETAERVVVHSHRAVEQLVELGLGRERIERIRHPVFEGEELPAPTGRTLLFFGLIRDYKGLDVLLEAFPAIPDARLVVAGDPVDPMPQVDLDGSVEWRLRFLPEAEVRDLMARAAAVVLPYRRLDSSGVLATAIGYRRPVVVTDVGSLGEIVREFGAGEVVPPDDPQALAQAAARLLEPKALAAAHEGARRAAEALTWTESAAEHDRLYREVRR